MAPSDATLVERLPGDDSGDELRELYRRYSSELFGFACNALGDRARRGGGAGCLRPTWRAAADYDSKRASVRTWLYTIARNRIVDARRRASVRPGLAPEPGERRGDRPGAGAGGTALAGGRRAGAALAGHREVIRLLRRAQPARDLREEGHPAGHRERPHLVRAAHAAPDPGRDGGAHMSACPTHGALLGLRAQLARPGRDGGDARPRRGLPRLRAGGEGRWARCPRCSTGLNRPTCRHPRCSPAIEEAVLDRFAQERRRARQPRRRWPRLTLPRLGALAAACAATVVLALVLLGEEENDSHAYASARLAPIAAGSRAPRPPPGRRMCRPARACACARADCATPCTSSGACARTAWVSGGTFRAARDGRAEAVLTAAVRPGDYVIVVTATAMATTARRCCAAGCATERTAPVRVAYTPPWGSQCWFLRRFSPASS